MLSRNQAPRVTRIERARTGRVGRQEIQQRPFGVDGRLVAVGQRITVVREKIPEVNDAEQR